jgi:hypothetical protein
MKINTEKRGQEPFSLKRLRLSGAALIWKKVPDPFFIPT